MHDAVPGLKEGILLEVGFDKTQPSRALPISSWAYEYGSSKLDELIDNRAAEVSCYRPEYTFVEKLQTVTTKFRQFQAEGKAKPSHDQTHPLPASETPLPSMVDSWSSWNRREQELE
ncbi:MAG: hypothetical protein MJE66_04950 [Proteobacteria bacterium]|nr:hypothetical protein [Pseudomonadota bacterium]